MSHDWEKGLSSFTITKVKSKICIASLSHRITSAININENSLPES